MACRSSRSAPPIGVSTKRAVRRIQIGFMSDYVAMPRARSVTLSVTAGPPGFYGLGQWPHHPRADRAIVWPGAVVCSEVIAPGWRSGQIQPRRSVSTGCSEVSSPWWSPCRDRCFPARLIHGNVPFNGIMPISRSDLGTIGAARVRSERRLTSQAGQACPSGHGRSLRSERVRSSATPAAATRDGPATRPSAIPSRAGSDRPNLVPGD